MRFYKISAIIFVLSTLLSGCLSIPDYPDTPQIEFYDISSTPSVDQNTGGYKDSVVISIKFKDGDGDLGYTQSEIDSLRNTSNYNYVVNQFRKVSGEYVPYVPIEPYSGYFFQISNEKPGPLEGIIHYNGVQIYHSFYPFPKDSIRFEVYIKDRAGNISNTITTDPVYVRYI